MRGRGIKVRRTASGGYSSRPNVITDEQPQPLLTEGGDELFTEE